MLPQIVLGLLWRWGRGHCCGEAPICYSARSSHDNGIARSRTIPSSCWAYHPLRNFMATPCKAAESSQRVATEGFTEALTVREESQQLIARLQCPYPDENINRRLAT